MYYKAPKEERWQKDKCVEPLRARPAWSRVDWKLIWRRHAFGRVLCHFGCDRRTATSAHNLTLFFRSQSLPGPHVLLTRVPSLNLYYLIYSGPGRGCAVPVVASSSCDVATELLEARRIFLVVCRRPQANRKTAASVVLFLFRRGWDTTERADYTNETGSPLRPLVRVALRGDSSETTHHSLPDTSRYLSRLAFCTATGGRSAPHLSLHSVRQGDTPHVSQERSQHDNRAPLPSQKLILLLARPQQINTEACFPFVHPEKLF